MIAEDKIYYLKRKLEDIIEKLEDSQEEMVDFYTKGKIRAYKNVLECLKDWE